MDFQYIKENINNNAELYTVSSSILIFYYNPYLFLCISVIFLVYNLCISDLQYDIRISNTKKNRDKDKNKINLVDRMLNMEKPLSDENLIELNNELKTKVE